MLEEVRYKRGIYEDFDDFYDYEEISDLLENDEISSEEEGFMLGYMDC
jgi:hypothetical protein